MAQKPRLILSSSLLALAAAASAGTITKSPDMGDYWHYVSSTATYVYADSFIAPSSGDLSLQSLGIWLDGGSSNLKFEILADQGGSLGPNGAAVLSSSAVFSGSYSSLTLVTMPMSSLNLVPGQKYWAAASTVGLGGSGGYYVGGHTQNSGGIVDNGTFWYSNDPTGLSFDGRNLTPEMAFQVNLAPVPEPTSMAALGLGAVAVLRRRRKA